MTVTSQSLLGIIIAVDPHSKTVVVDIGTVNYKGESVYLQDVPYDPELSKPNTGDKVSVLVESTVEA